VSLCGCVVVVGASGVSVTSKQLDTVFACRPSGPGPSGCLRSPGSWCFVCGPLPHWRSSFVVRREWTEPTSPRHTPPSLSITTGIFSSTSRGFVRWSTHRTHNKSDSDSGGDSPEARRRLRTADGHQVTYRGIGNNEALCVLPQATYNPSNYLPGIYELVDALYHVPW